MFFNLHINNRPFSIIEGTFKKHKGILSQCARVGLKFLSLVPKASPWTHAAFGGYESIVQLNQAKKNFCDHKIECLKNLARASCHTALMGLLILGGSAGALAVHAAGYVAELKTLFSHLYDKEGRKALSSIALLAVQSVYIASIIYLTPEWIVASLLLQMIKELKDSYTEFREGNYLEMCGSFILVALRAVKGKEDFFKVKRDWFGKKVTEKEWKEFVEEVHRHQEKNTKELFDAEKFFQKRDLSSRISGIKASDENLTDIFFRQIRFANCTFDRSELDRSKFSQVNFSDSSFSQARCVRSIFDRVTFERCSLEGLNAYLSSFSDVTIDTSQIHRAYFNDACLGGLKIRDSKLEGTSFLHAKVKDSYLERCDLTNVILADAKSKFKLKKCANMRFTKPVVALTWNFEDKKYYASLIKEGLEQSGAIVMPFHYEPSDVSQTALFLEIQAKANALKTFSNPDAFSRADEFVSDIGAYENIKKLSDRALEIHKYADGIFLSGGEDVERTLYLNEAPSELEDFRRSILELLLLKKAYKDNIPLFATCRGSQIANVYLGGTLKTVGWQMGIKQFQWATEDQDLIYRFQTLLGSKEIFGYSSHHQAMDQVSERLEVVARDGEIPKLAVSKEGKPITLTQFHPEFYVEIPEIKKKLEDFFEEISEKQDPKSLFIKFQIVLAKEYLKKVEGHQAFYKEFLSSLPIQKK